MEKNAKKLKLFCIPYAGGYASVYLRWLRYLNDGIELIPVELSGRGKRATEKLYNSFYDAIDDVFEFVLKKHNNEPFALFGHSMGGRIVYEVAVRFCNLGMLNLKHVFISGMYPPNINKLGKKLYELSNEDFLHEIINLGGVSGETVKKYRDLIDTFLPVIKNDYRIFELYKSDTSNLRQITYDITALTGNDDNIVLIDEARLWGMYTKGKFELFCFKGDHFFINKYINEITEIIMKKVIFLN